MNEQEILLVVKYDCLQCRDFQIFFESALALRTESGIKKECVSV
jgi:hypothetical protein